MSTSSHAIVTLPSAQLPVGSTQDRDHVALRVLREERRAHHSVVAFNLVAFLIYLISAV